MNKELFGVFGDRETFLTASPTTAFDRVLEGPSITVGVRDVGLGAPGFTCVHDGDGGVCLLWGEVYPPPGVDANPAEWLFEEYCCRGAAPLGELNGSYLAVIDTGADALVATDPARTRECYYTDQAPARTFGTDPARVASLVPDPTVANGALRQFLLFGNVLGEATVLSGLHRVPFDGCLRESGTRSLARFVYEPERFDYVGELASRLRRALERRAGLPGSKGLLLSGGYDSRLLLADGPSIDVCFTVGKPDVGEAAVAKQVARQYGVDHETLVVDGRYLNTAPEAVQYTHGVKESVHMHHAGYTGEMDVDTIYHGGFCDTYLRGYFLPRDGIELFGHTLPRNRLDPDPDAAEILVDDLGFRPASRYFPDGPTPDWADKEFLASVVEERFEAHEDRFDSLYNGMDLVGIENQRATPFRNHLADNFLESFVAADQEQLDWHLRTPPARRNVRTYLDALRRLDSDILQYRPPDRPYDSYRANEVEGFVRRKLPLVDSFDTPWPDRDDIYDRYHEDDGLFDRSAAVTGLPARLKLRLNDVTTWIELATDTRLLTPDDALACLADGPSSR